MVSARVREGTAHTGRERGAGGFLIADAQNAPKGYTHHHPPLPLPQPPPRLLLALALASLTASTTATPSPPATRPAGFVDAPHPGASPPPTPSCAALVAASPHTTTAPSGDVTLWGGWEEWACMRGARVRGFLTLRPAGGGGGGAPSLDACTSVDAGFQIDTWAFDAGRVASAEEADACRPPYCV